jgi:ligand-binding sensor domain-containing protein
MHKALPGLIRAGLALCISLLLASSRPAVAADNDWLARIWRTDNGLLDNSISGLAQTPEGYLWVGTDGGLMRFDGARFQEFSLISLQGVANRVIRTQVLDHRGRLWLGMDRGTVVCVEPDRARVFSARDGLPDLRATVMAEDGDGAIWIAYSGALGVSRIKDGQVTRFSVQDGLPPAGTCWLASDAKGQLWFAKGGFVGVFREGRFQTLQTLDTVTMRITAAHSGGIWICDASRLLKYDEGRGLPETVKMAQPGATPTVLLEDRAGVLWIGTSAHGLFRYDGSTFETVTTSHPEITCLVEDRENNIWVGTRGGGLNQLQPAF